MQSNLHEDCSKDLVRLDPIFPVEMQKSSSPKVRNKKCNEAATKTENDNEAMITVFYCKSSISFSVITIEKVVPPSNAQVLNI